MPDWLKKAVFYEIYPQSFLDTNGDGIGDINGITQKLDYIKSLGCNAIWINPCFDSPFMDAGYDVSDYTKVAPRYGSNEDLINCFSQAHKRGMRILLDLVPGHTSDRHEWFKKSKESAPNEFSDRYIWTNSVWDAPPEYRFAIGAAERDGNYMLNFFNCQPALNYGFAKITHKEWQKPCDHPDCRATVEALKSIMRYWLDRGADGFRVDMADSLVKNDDDKTATQKIWREIRDMLDADYPEAVLTSEWSHPQRACRCGFHCDFYLDHQGNGYNSLCRFIDKDSGEQKSFFSKQGKGDVTLFTKDYEERYSGSKDYGYISFITGNHDTPRLRRYFDEKELKIAYATLFMFPGAPFLYYGDEIGMRFIENLPSKEGGFSRTGSRTPMQWNSGKNYGFSAAPREALYLPQDDSPDAPTVEAEERDPDSLLNFVKRVIALRNEYEDLQADGDFETIYAQKNAYPFIFRRGRFMILVNPSAKSANAPIALKGSVVFAEGGEVSFGETTETPPQSFAVVKIN